MKMYCRNCDTVVEAVERHEYDVNYHEYTCPICMSDDLTGIKLCSCGNEMSAEDDFCKTCYEELNQVLTEFMEEHRMSVEQLEDIISNHFGW